MNNIKTIIRQTLLDQVRYKSFYLFTALAVMIILIIRSCYNADFTVNGKQVDSVTLAWYTSKIAFYLISFGLFFLTVLLGSRIFTRDSQEGFILMFFSRPVKRTEYVLARTGGLWIFLTLFQFILHLTLFIISWIKTGGRIPGYLTGSLAASLDILFILSLSFLFSLFLHDFIAVCLTLVSAGAGFIIDAVYSVMQNQTVQSMVNQTESSDSLIKMIYPKTGLMLNYAASLFTHNSLNYPGPLHPVLNIALWCLFLIVLNLVFINKKEL